MNIHTLDMPEGNLKATDRILSLSVIDGKDAKTTAGSVDKRLFTGENQLHLTMDLNSSLWTFRYSQNGLLPGPLQGTFTSFKKGFECAELYFQKRNVKITEIKD